MNIQLSHLALLIIAENIEYIKYTIHTMNLMNVCYDKAHIKRTNFQADYMFHLHGTGHKQFYID